LPPDPRSRSGTGSWRALPVCPSCPGCNWETAEGKREDTTQGKMKPQVQSENNHCNSSVAYRFIPWMSSWTSSMPRSSELSSKRDIFSHETHSH
jgi:hypothetical protein